MDRLILILVALGFVQSAFAELGARHPIPAESLSASGPRLRLGGDAEPPHPIDPTPIDPNALVVRESDWGPNPDQVKMTLAEFQVLEFTNMERVRHGRKKVHPTQMLMDFAREKSKNMAANYNLSHGVPPTVDKAEMRVSRREQNVTWYTSAKENIAWLHATPEEVVSGKNGWINSKDGHKEALLATENDEFGAAVAYSKPDPRRGKPNPEPYWTQVFHLPKKKA